MDMATAAVDLTLVILVLAGLVTLAAILVRSTGRHLTQVRAHGEPDTCASVAEEMAHEDDYAYERITPEEHAFTLTHSSWEQVYVPRDYDAENRYGDSDDYERRNEPARGSAVCALDDCHEPAAYTCVCCNRRVCWFDMSGTTADAPGICHECLFACDGGMVCTVTGHANGSQSTSPEWSAEAVTEFRRIVAQCHLTVDQASDLTRYATKCAEQRITNDSNDSNAATREHVIGRDVVFGWTYLQEEA